MERKAYMYIAVYSSILNSVKPDYFPVKETTTTKCLIAEYLRKLQIQPMDHNLITLWRIKSYNDAKVRAPITSDVYEKLRDKDLIITTAQRSGKEFYSYYISFEKGIQVKVSMNVTNKEDVCDVVLISKYATANILINLIRETTTFQNTNILYLRHRKGILKGDENLFNLIKSSKSDEFFVEIDKQKNYEEFVKMELLKKLKVDYDKKRSKSAENNMDKFYSNLSKTLYHNASHNHRKLPDIISTVPEKSSDLEGSPGDQDYVEEISNAQPISKRSLPMPPPSIQQNSTLPIDTSNNIQKENAIEYRQKVQNHPPEPILRTNFLDNSKSSSSSSSILSTSEDSMVNGQSTLRDTALLKTNIANNHQFPNLYEIVKRCDMFAVEIFDSQPFKIEFTETFLTDTLTQCENRPKGPNPTLGCGNSAFKTIESSTEKNKYIVVVVENILHQNITISKQRIQKGDILVEIDDENVLAKTKDYINYKLSISTRHTLIIARLKSDSQSNEEKDEKINRLKAELEALKLKYSDLHQVTVDNDHVIHKLTKVLKKQEKNMEIDKNI